MTEQRKPVRGIFKYCKVQKKVVPVDQVIEYRHANAAHGYIPDEMPPTKHPLTGKYYTSKAKFRAETTARGYQEVGNEYEKPEKVEQSKPNPKFKEQMRELLHTSSRNEYVREKMNQFQKLNQERLGRK